MCNIHIITLYASRIKSTIFDESSVSLPTKANSETSLRPCKINQDRNKTYTSLYIAVTSSGKRHLVNTSEISFQNIIIIITSNDDIRPSTLITDQSPSGLLLD